MRITRKCRITKLGLALILLAALSLAARLTPGENSRQAGGHVAAGQR